MISDYLVINAILEVDRFPFFQVMPALLAVDDDFTESFENPADSESQLTVKNNLLSVNQILESVCSQCVTLFSNFES